MECSNCEKEICTGSYSICQKCERVICAEVSCNDDGICANRKTCREAQSYNREADRKLQLIRAQAEQERCGNCGGSAVRDVNRDLRCVLYCKGPVPAL
jgi:hypothetical protein